MSFLGFDTSDPAGLQKAIEAARPVMDEIEMRAAGIVDTLVTRLGGTKITITIDIPKAGADWVKTPPNP